MTQLTVATSVVPETLEDAAALAVELNGIISESTPCAAIATADDPPALATFRVSVAGDWVYANAGDTLVVAGQLVLLVLSPADAATLIS